MLEPYAPLLGLSIADRPLLGRVRLAGPQGPGSLEENRAFPSDSFSSTFEDSSLAPSAFGFSLASKPHPWVLVFSDDCPHSPDPYRMA